MQSQFQSENINVDEIINYFNEMMQHRITYYISTTLLLIILFTTMIYSTLKVLIRYYLSKLIAVILIYRMNNVHLYLYCFYIRANQYMFSICFLLMMKFDIKAISSYKQTPQRM